MFFKDVLGESLGYLRNSFKQYPNKNRWICKYFLKIPWLKVVGFQSILLQGVIG